jgi:hypothetical protein
MTVERAHGQGLVFQHGEFRATVPVPMASEP